MLSQQEALSLEPNISCVAALLSPVSGIIDSAAYMESLLADAQAAGATLALNTRLLGGVLASSKSDTHVLELQGLDPDAVVSSRGSSCPAGPVTEDEAQTSSHSGDSAVNPAAKEPKYRLRAKMVVNSAGMQRLLLV